MMVEKVPLTIKKQSILKINGLKNQEIDKGI